MSEMPERIWLEDGNDEYPSFYFDDSVDCTEYIRADLVAEKDAEIERLRDALQECARQLSYHTRSALGGIRRDEQDAVDEARALIAELREKEAYV